MEISDVIVDGSQWDDIAVSSNTGLILSLANARMRIAEIPLGVKTTEP